MAFTQADLDAFDQAIAAGRGVKGFTFGDQSTQFHPVDDVLKIRALIKRDVDSAPTHRFAVTSKGT